MTSRPFSSRQSGPEGKGACDWLVSRLVEAVLGVEQAVVAAVDGLLLAASDGSCADSAEQLAAITAGMQSLAEGVARLSGKGTTEQVLLRMRGGHLIVTVLGEGSRLAVLTGPKADVKVVAYQMVLLAENAAHVLDSPVRAGTPQRGVAR